MTSAIPVSNALLRIVSERTPNNAVLAQAYESGEVYTRKATPRPKGSLGRLALQFIPTGRRTRPVSPDKAASMKRKRSLAGPSELPDKVKEIFTQGEQSVLAVVVREVMKRGCCDLCIDEIAALAGVSRTTVQNAMRKAKDGEARLITVEERPRRGLKNLSNIVRIISVEWIDWIKRRIGFKKLNTTYKPVLNTSLSECAETLLRAFESGSKRPRRLYQAEKGADHLPEGLTCYISGLLDRKRYG